MHAPTPFPALPVLPDLHTSIFIPPLITFMLISEGLWFSYGHSDYFSSITATTSSKIPLILPHHTLKKVIISLCTCYAWIGSYFQVSFRQEIFHRLLIYFIFWDWFSLAYTSLYWYRLDSTATIDIRFSREDYLPFHISHALSWAFNTTESIILQFSSSPFSSHYGHKRHRPQARHAADTLPRVMATAINELLISFSLL